MPPNLTSGATLLLAEATMCPPVSVQSPYVSSMKARAKPVVATPASHTQVSTPAPPQSKPPGRPRWQIVWRNVAAFAYLHAATIYAIIFVFHKMHPFTLLFGFLTAACAAIGITAGAHRLWAHRSYKAKWPMRLILTIFQTTAFQNHIYEWVRDHRVHHKFTDTNADPHNASRGFFFSHIGWLMVRKHPDVREKGKGIQMSDLEADPFVVFQRKYYMILMPLCTFIIPTLIPMYLWGEDGWNAWYCSVARYTLGLNGTWLVNSAAHIWGTKPIEKAISSAENISVAWIAFGEGWHNYHHVFPWDYKAAELGNYKGNLTTAFIDFFAKIGWAYDLKTVDASMVEKRAQRTGDGTHPKYTLKEVNTEPEPHSHYNPYGRDVWGWGDVDMKVESVAAAKILCQSGKNSENVD